MIKVLEKPKKPPRQLRCWSCKALLSFEVEDLICGYFEGDWTESGPKGVGINCPECRRDIHWSDAPTYVVDEAWANKKASKEKDK